MLLNKETAEKQRGFARYCRGGTFDHFAKISEDKAGVYRRLVFNNIDGNLENAYPITFSYLTNEQWNELVQDFFIKSDLPSPLLWRMPKELLSFVKKEKYSKKFNMPFLDDLLLFEWEEIDVYMMPNQKMPYENHPDAFYEVPLLNPEHKVLDLQYPVFKTRNLKNLSEKGAYFVSLHRHPKNKEVLFFEHSYFYMYLFELMKEQKDSMRDLLKETAQVFNIIENEALVEKTKRWLREMEGEGLLLGWTSI
ncbi:hypothetical protein AB751O23_AA_00470 [Chlamydiales bacterium SCGC AB-751-O23]|jgi:uncharacterized protein|nr:hypothetical protein AB751O23_AA_00470 [Chlamydiales bacterium SCGC AB-751-O23]